MPALLELQRALRDSLVGSRRDAALPFIHADGCDPAARLAIHRNTLWGTLSRALKLTYPVVERLVGSAFFAAAADAFVRTHPARGPLLDEYGVEFAVHLDALPAAASVPYVGDVARLEWCVSCALHAEDAAPLDVVRLSALAPAEHGRVRFTPHPSLGLLCARYPVDAIWRAVLRCDDAALAAVDLDAGPVWLVIHRGPSGVDVTRIDEGPARFTQRLVAGDTLDDALPAIGTGDAAAILADHLRAGRFTAFTVHP